MSPPGPLQMIHAIDLENAGDLSSHDYPPHELYIDQDSAIYKLGGPVNRIICSERPFDVMLCFKSVCAHCLNQEDIGSGLIVSNITPQNSPFQGRPFIHRNRYDISVGALVFEPRGANEASYDLPVNPIPQIILFEDTGNECKPRAGVRDRRAGLTCSPKSCHVCNPSGRNGKKHRRAQEHATQKARHASQDVSGPSTRPEATSAFAQPSNHGQNRGPPAHLTVAAARPTEMIDLTLEDSPPTAAASRNDDEVDQGLAEMPAFDLMQWNDGPIFPDLAQEESTDAQEQTIPAAAQIIDLTGGDSPDRSTSAIIQCPQEQAPPTAAPLNDEAVDQGLAALPMLERMDLDDDPDILELFGEHTSAPPQPDPELAAFGAAIAAAHAEIEAEQLQVVDEAAVEADRANDLALEDLRYVANPGGLTAAAVQSLNARSNIPAPSDSGSMAAFDRSVLHQDEDDDDGDGTAVQSSSTLDHIPAMSTPINEATGHADRADQSSSAPSAPAVTTNAGGVKVVNKGKNKKIYVRSNFPRPGEWGYKDPPPPPPPAAGGAAGVVDR